VQPSNGLSRLHDLRRKGHGGGLDPDFVELSGAKVDSQGKLSVTPTQNQVTLVITATNRSTQRSQARSISFTIVT
jgi:hypothetical protein